MKIIITTLFGLEAPTRDDLLARGFSKSQLDVKDGVITLETGNDDWALDVARVNMWARHAERVFFEVGAFKTGSSENFTEDGAVFFESCKKLPWNDYIPKGWAFIVNGFSRKSKLDGIKMLQKLTKKAIARSLAASRGLGPDSVIAEDEHLGTVSIQFALVNNYCRMLIDTTGEGLHKRGYRPLTHEAPIRETLAAGMITYARYSPFGKEALVDPMCGSGTIVIEAAQMAAGIAPGRFRHFDYEKLPYIGNRAYRAALEEAIDNEDLTAPDDCYFFGSDIDSRAVRSAIANARSAGVADFCRFDIRDAREISPESLASYTGMERQLVLTNPPYGGRLMTPEEADDIYRLVARRLLTSSGQCKKGIRLSLITPDDAFEEATGFKADKRIKLYNGSKVCHLFNYYKLGLRR